MPASFLGNSPKLKSFYAYYQDLNTIPVQFLNNHTDLINLVLPGFPLSITDLSAFAAAPQLESLNVNWACTTKKACKNSISTLGTFPHLPNLTSLNLNYIPISEIPTSFPPKVPAHTTLNLQFSPIEMTGYSSPALLEVCNHFTKFTPDALCDNP